MIVGCDCAGCNCAEETPGPSPTPTVTSPPSITASPTTTQDVVNFVQLQAAVNSAIAWIRVVTMSITIASTLVIDGYDMRIYGSSPINGSATLDGGGSVQIFQVMNGGRTVASARVEAWAEAWATSRAAARTAATRASARAAATPVTPVTQVPKDTKHNTAPAGAVVGGAFLAFLVLSGLSVSFVACCSLLVGFCGFVASCLLRCMACLFFVLA